jgi:hypothetical protein
MEQRESAKIFRTYFSIAKKTFILFFFLYLLFISGCSGPSPREMALMQLEAALGMVIDSWFLIVLLTLMTKKLNLSKNLLFLMQFAFFIILYFIIYNQTYFQFNEAIRLTTIGAVVSIPYLLVLTTGFLTILPRSLLKYLPSFVLTPFFAMCGLLFFTESETILNLQPVVLTLIYWPATIAAVIFFSIILIVQRRYGGIAMRDENKDVKQIDKPSEESA